MKQLLSYIFLLFSLTTTYAQAPQQMNYQAIVRNSIGDIVPGGTTVALKFSIHDGTPTGTVVFTETQTTTTNQFGLVNLQIGTISNNLGTVDWGNGAKYLQVDADINNTGTFTSMGTSQLISVPYALYAANSNVGPAGPMGPQGVPGPAGVDGVGTHQLKKLFTLQELQTLASGGAVQLLPSPPSGFVYHIMGAVMIITTGTDTLGSPVHGFGIGGDMMMSYYDAPFLNNILISGATQKTDFEQQHGYLSIPLGSGLKIRVFYPFSVGNFNGRFGLVMMYALLDVDGL